MQKNARHSTWRETLGGARRDKVQKTRQGVQCSSPQKTRQGVRQETKHSPRRVTRAKDLAVDAMLAALLLVLQIALAGLPNIELVSLLLILYTLVFGRQVFIILAVFLLVEGFLYGFGIWWISYLYVWPILCLAAGCIRRHTGVFAVSALSCIFGLGFGLLCSLTYLVSGGPGAALSWWMAGIPYDMIHGVSNLVLSLVLFQPLYRLLSRLKNSF